MTIKIETQTETQTTTTYTIAGLSDKEVHIIRTLLGHCAFGQVHQLFKLLMKLPGMDRKIPSTLDDAPVVNFDFTGTRHV